VSATIQRQAWELVHLKTEHETFVVTPEHPFATPHSGWVGAGALSPGDLVQSARAGAARVSAVREETLLHPVPVFNLSVEHTHAYLVGTNGVLVHNIGCLGKGKGKSKSKEKAKDKKDTARYIRNRAAARREVVSLWEQAYKEEYKSEKREKILERITRLEAHLKEEMLKRIVGFRIRIANNREVEAKLREAKPRHSGEDAKNHDAQIEQLLGERNALMEELARTRVLEFEDRTPRGTRWFHGGREDLDGDRLQAIQRELAEGGLSPERLTELERELASSEPIDDAYVAAIWRAINAIDSQVKRARPPESGANDRNRLPPLERPDFQRLRNELREERGSFEAEDVFLANQYAELRVQADLLAPVRQPESSDRRRKNIILTAQIAENSQRRQQLRENWHRSLRTRLVERQERLENMRGRRPRDEVAMAELEREIALLEHERSSPL
jgi:hypothetical protein